MLLGTQAAKLPNKLYWTKVGQKTKYLKKFLFDNSYQLKYKLTLKLKFYKV